MLKKFAVWFIYFGLSFLFESWGWAEQGKAFLIIYLVATGLVMAGVILIWIFDGDELGERVGMSLVSALLYTGRMFIILFATWCAAQLFAVDYYVAFQIMSFGQCLCSSSKKDD